MRGEHFMIMSASLFSLISCQLRELMCFIDRELEHDTGSIILTSYYYTILC
jgi:hypothetical protein